MYLRINDDLQAKHFTGPLGSGPEVLPGAAEISWRG